MTEGGTGRLSRRAAGVSPEVGSDRERRSAAAAPGGIGVTKREPRTHHARHVVDLDAFEILRAEGVDEDPYTLLLEDLVVGLRPVLDVEAVLESRTAARQHGAPKPGILVGPVVGHELAHLGLRRGRKLEHI